MLWVSSKSVIIQLKQSKLVHSVKYVLITVIVLLNLVMVSLVLEELVVIEMLVKEWNAWMLVIWIEKSIVIGWKWWVKWVDYDY